MRFTKSLYDILIHRLAMLNSQDPHFFSFDLIHDTIIPDAKLPVASQCLAKRCAGLVRSASQRDAMVSAPHCPGVLTA